MRKLVWIVVLACVVGACEQPVNNDIGGEQVSLVRPGEAGVQVLYAVPAAVFARTTPAERKDAMLAAASIFHGEQEGDLDVGHFLRSNATLQEKHAAARSMLDRYDEAEWYILQQLLAAPMLDLLLQSEGGRSDQAALALYTRLLLQNENPSGDLLAHALPLLRGYWSDEEVGHAARQSLAASTKWLSQTCPDCALTGARGAAQKATGVQPNDRYASISQSLDVLRDLSRL